MRRRSLLGAAALLPGVARAQAPFPARSVRIIVPYAPGGTSDLTARLMAQAASTASGQSFVVENRGGGASIPGTQAIVAAVPDGYTIGMADLALVTNPGLFGARLPYETERDLAPVGNVGSAPVLLVAHPAAPARSVAEFLALARAKPGDIPVAHAGNGTGGHLAIELLQLLGGVRCALVGYRGAGPTNAAILGGEVPYGFVPAPVAKAQVEAGGFRALAVAAAARNPALPGIPTFAEAGLEGMVAESFYGVVAPAGVPAPIVERLNALLVRPAREPALAARFLAMGFAVDGRGPADFAAQIHEEIPRWREVIRRAGVVPE